MNQKLIVPISQEDAENIINGATFDWTFTTNKGEQIDVHVELEDNNDYDF